MLICILCLICRVVLAALHFNENANRKQATTKAGAKRYNLCFRKARKEFCVKEVKVDCTYSKFV